MCGLCIDYELNYRGHIIRYNHDHGEYYIEDILQYVLDYLIDGFGIAPEHMEFIEGYDGIGHFKYCCKLGCTDDCFNDIERCRLKWVTPNKELYTIIIYEENLYCPKL